MAGLDWYALTVRVALRKLFALGRADLFGTYPDEVAPPSGYDSWPAYQRAKELSVVTDFLPLGDPAEGAKLTMVWTRTGEDVATCGMHFVHANPDILGDTLAITDDELAAIEARVDAMWVAIRDQFPSSLVLDRYEWHDFGVGIRRPNPKRRETLGLASGGTGAADEALPPQVATSVTLKTNHRKTWGRIFLPAQIKDSCVSGRILAARVSDIRDAFGALLDGVAGDDTPLVIWSPRHDGGPLKFGKETIGGVVVDHHAAGDDLPDTTSYAKGVNQVQVDDLFDVMESRRFDAALIRDTHTLGA